MWSYIVGDFYCLLIGLFTWTDVENLVSEIIEMQEFNHPHVMPLIGVCLDTGPGVSMVMPFMANGSLLDYLKKKRSSLVIRGGEPVKVSRLVNWRT